MTENICRHLTDLTSFKDFNRKFIKVIDARMKEWKNGNKKRAK